MIIDTHAHLYLEAFEKDIVEIIERAKKTGIESIYLPNINSKTIDAVFDLSDRYPGFFYPMMGLHPVHVDEGFREELQVIEARMDEREIFAIGEIGSDAYWEKKYMDEQEEAFHIQCQWALERDLPIVIHARDSLDWQIDMVSSYGGRLRGVFHCFTGTSIQAQKILDAGFYLGIGGIVTYKNTGLDEVLYNVPLDSLVLETDAPYLAPVPKRGKRNESSYLKYILIRLSEIYNVPEQDIARITTRNAKKIFHRENGI